MKKGLSYSGFHFLCCMLMAVFYSCQPELPQQVEAAYDQLPPKLDFNQHVKPILSDKCFACHGPDAGKRKAGLRLDQAVSAFAELAESPGKKAIVKGNLNRSQLFHRIISEDPERQMPPADFKVELSDQEKAILIKWIEDGAEYKPHWAFSPPEKAAVPAISIEARAKNPIDHFILQKLESMSLRPSPEAEKELLLRRLSLDLTGLPPTIEEMNAFLEDESVDAYEKQVDRLLASVHYGEKMTTDWMDLARYSDTYGYTVDRYRDMSPWRDWVIQAFNENMPYDKFVSWQLAGDLFPNPSREQMIATSFNRLHPQNMEGGIVDEEFRVEYVADRVAVLGDGLMGLTLSCARCHDHKFDPISQKEYYQLYSFFNNINEIGQISWDDATPVPNMLLPTQQQEKLIDSLGQAVKVQEEKLKALSESKKEEIAQWISNANHKKLSPSSRPKGMVAHYPLNKEPIRNALQPSQLAKMGRPFSDKEIPVFTDGIKEKGLLLDGDAWIDLKGVGVFNRDNAFTIGLWIYVPEELEEGVIFHKNNGARLHCYRGYHLYLRENKLEWVLARTWPDNAIILQTEEEIPKDQWFHLSVSYDGSSKAAGCKIYVNGLEAPVSIENDNLYKDIFYHSLSARMNDGAVEPNVKIGARWRGVGIKGAKVDEIMVFDRELTALELKQIVNPQSVAALAEKSSKQLNELDKEQLAAYYLHNHSSEYQDALKALAKVRFDYVQSLEPVQELMIMREMEAPRQAYVLNRGLYNDYGEKVYPNTPESILPFAEDLPKNRLGLAQWLFDEANPLTARVAVNRYWQMYFGQGLVKTTEDFGNQGTLPTHPVLLDWLAIYFIESGWDVKALQKLIVTSATYRQSSLASEEMLDKDNDNVWLARGPGMRLSSEMMRDNALVASGLFNPTVGGESVKPYQPEGVWAMNSGSYVPDEGESLYRRSMYTYWRRTAPNPTLETFDQPERSICTVRRQKTNTPLQALVLLNDPTFLEATKVLGEQMARGENVEESIRMAYRRLTGKNPLPSEMNLLLALQKEEYEVFSTQVHKAKGWLDAGNYEADISLDPALIASHAVVANVILNSDAAITKR